MAANSSGRATPSIVASSRTGRCDGTSASKVLDLLEAVAARDRPVGLSEMSIATGIPKSTAHRLLKTLESHHLIGRVGSKYQLGEHLADLGDGARTAATAGSSTRPARRWAGCSNAPAPSSTSVS